MDLVKSQDFFSPLDVKKRIHIIGCGSVGSTIAELLARLGITNISLYDFDIVSAHNIANQMFFNDDIKRPKVEAVKDIICRINPDAESNIKLFHEGYTDSTNLSGYVFLCVDNIDLRREIVEKNKHNQSICAMFDFRTRLTDAQHYSADWADPKQIQSLLNTMDFSHEEAHEATPATACNIEMGVAPTVRTICSYGVSNFMNFILGKPLKKMVLADAFNFTLDAY